MSGPQLENGYTKIVNEVLDALCRVPLGGYERRVFDAIIRKTWGFNKKEDVISNSQLCEMTGLHKAHVSRALKKLLFLYMVTKNGNKISIQKRPDLWIIRTALPRELPKMVTTEKLPKMVKVLPKMVTEVTKNGNKKLPKMADTKYNINKNKETLQNKGKYAPKILPYENELKTLLKRWNELFFTKFKVASHLHSNYEHWRTMYSQEDILRSIENASKEKNITWRKVLTPEIFLRRKNPNREDVNRIEQYLNSEVQESKPQSKLMMATRELIRKGVKFADE